MSTKKEQLKDKVVALVKEFVASEGGITFVDLEFLFGRNSGVMGTLARTLKVSF